MPTPTTTTASADADDGSSAGGIEEGPDSSSSSPPPVPDDPDSDPEVLAPDADYLVPDAVDRARPSSSRRAGGAGDDALDCAALVDSFVEPLYALPAHDPTARMAAAYDAHRAARATYDELRKKREKCERKVEGELGRLHNLLRESREREEKAGAELRERTHRVYEEELGAAGMGSGADREGDEEDFNGVLARVKGFAKRYGGPPPSEEELDELIEEGKPEHVAAEYREEALELSRWIKKQKETLPPPHRCAALESAGIALPLTEEDEWRRMLHRFKVYARDYFKNPLLVRNTNGDLLRAVDEQGKSQSHGAKAELRTWCRAQQDAYEWDGMRGDPVRFEDLADAGFAFDAVADDDAWSRLLTRAEAYRKRHGHLRVPSDYVDETVASGKDEDGSGGEEGGGPPIPSLDLAEFVRRVRALVHRVALSPRRLAALSSSGLRPVLGGTVHAFHVEHCVAGREERGEPLRIKRKRKALAKVDPRPRSTRAVLGIDRPKRGDLEVWAAKLERIVAHKNETGTVLGMRNSVKLQQWMFSTVRKLANNSKALEGEKMDLIEAHPGLKEFLLQKEIVEVALAEAAKRKAKEAAIARGEKQPRRGGGSKAGKDAGGGEGGAEVRDDEEEEDIAEGGDSDEEGGERGGGEDTQHALEELAEDDDVAAFMESGLQVPAV